jgi:hypothetical protein
VGEPGHPLQLQLQNTPLPGHRQCWAPCPPYEYIVLDLA